MNFDSAIKITINSKLKLIVIFNFSAVTYVFDFYCAL